MSEKKPNDKPTLIDQQVALSAYLDSLLREVDQRAPYDEPAAVHVLHQPKVADVEEVEVAAPAPVEQEPISSEQVDEEIAEDEFQCLLFSVRGLTLAVPLDKLSGILEWDGEATKLPERPDWFLGVMNYRDQQAGIVDAAGVVMPERMDESEVPEYGHIIFFDEGRWGFACESVKQVVRLKNEEVRWRTTRTQRPWLAGTVIEHMCALLDVDAVAEMIQG